VVATLIKAGTIPILLGGGHETSFGHFLGYALSSRQVSILNIDAHPDVRPLVEGKPNSGSPFRQALEHCSRSCRDYTVMGLNPHTVAHWQVEYILSHGGHCLWQGDFTLVDFEKYLAQTSAPTMVTFDLDVLDQAFAPGVSAPNANGTVPSLWLQLALLAGISEKVTSLDITELNPKYDIDDRTARIAALAIWKFLWGIGKRDDRPRNS
jgi:formiminoglutamase